MSCAHDFFLHFSSLKNGQLVTFCESQYILEEQDEYVNITFYDFQRILLLSRTQGGGLELKQDLFLLPKFNAFYLILIWLRLTFVCLTESRRQIQLHVSQPCLPQSWKAGCAKATNRFTRGLRTQNRKLWVLGQASAATSAAGRGTGQPSAAKKQGHQDHAAGIPETPRSRWQGLTCSRSYPVQLWQGLR
jgi:hypothetical protein